MGPPSTTLCGSFVSPANSMTSRRRVPMMMFALQGRAMASPETVKRLLTRGIPVFRKRPMEAMVVTLFNMTPTSVWRFPRGTTRPVALCTSTFSAPCG